MDRFFEKTHCDRCGEKLVGRILSWFTDATICLDCSGKEDEIKERLRQQGKNPDDYEGCGYIPQV